jgi:hypothetical protein
MILFEGKDYRPGTEKSQSKIRACTPGILKWWFNLFSIDPDFDVQQDDLTRQTAARIIFLIFRPGLFG